MRATCDPERVAQLLRILIDNAITHTPPGTAVRVRAAPPNGAGRRSSRSTTGARESRATASGAIFEPFYSADGTRGAGLGLAIAHELAVQMAARLEVASSAGRHDLHADPAGRRSDARAPGDRAAAGHAVSLSDHARDNGAYDAP